MKSLYKKGAVLSPVLFTVCIDGLLQRLHTSGVGCHIVVGFSGAFGYADDIVFETFCRRIASYDLYL